MSNAMRLKAKIRNIAKQKNIPAQVVLQNYMFERLYFWNEYPFSSIMLKDAADYTLARGIAYFKGTFNVNYAGIASYLYLYLRLRNNRLILRTLNTVSRPHILHLAWT